MDEQILNTVHSIFGKNVKIVDCEKTSSLSEEEVLLINGVPVKLDEIPDNDGYAIKAALLQGQTPSVDQLNKLLYQAGLLQQPIQLETALSVKSSSITKEEVSLSRHGALLDKRSSETKEEFLYQSHQTELLNPIQCKTVQKLNSNISEIPNLGVEITEVETKPLTGNEKYSEQEQRFKKKKEMLKNNKPNISKSVSNNTVSSCSYVDTNSDASSTISEYITFTLAKDNIATSSPPNAVYEHSNTPSKPGMSDKTSWSCTRELSSSNCDSGHDDIFQSSSNCNVTDCDDVAPTLPCWCNNETIAMKKNVNDQITGIADISTCKWYYKKPRETNVVDAKILKIENECLKYCDGKILSGSLNTLILQLVPTYNYFCNDEYMRTFLLNIRYITPISEIMKAVFEIWNLENVSKRSELNFDQQSLAAQNYMLFLSRWKEMFSDDFKDELFKEAFNNGVEECSQIKAMKPELLKMLHQTESQEHINERELNLISTFVSIKNLSVINVCKSPLTLARQLTLIELEYLKNISEFDVINTLSIVRFSDNLNFDTLCIEIHFLKDIKSVYTYLHWFSRLCHLTASEILKSPKTKQRLHIVDYWIDTAVECLNIGNFNSSMAILAGLVLPSVQRLRKMWSRVKCSKFSALKNQLDPADNFRSYFSTINAAMWRFESAKENCKENIIPYFAVFLKEMQDLKNNAMTRLPNGHLNFEHFSHFTTHMNNFIKWRNCKCSYSKLLNIANILRCVDIFEDAESLLEASFKCESVKSDEKDMYKKIKSKIKNK